MELTKQRFQCKQCNLVWETLIHPYTPDHKKIRMEFSECINPDCKSENFIERKVGKEII